ncbi:MAG: hypothetical protein K9L98_00425 [Candidatus Pacebacteria bacterium]|nr:hypothetical protein [Candidatus Paceibacterota bacterium]MCF7862463.1 hypothetical protein [Candidatus Paceibacterota bacterium]
MYNPKHGYVIYCNSCYESDSWDKKSYFVNYDENRPFFDQFQELFKKTPKASLYISKASGINLNSDYVNYAGGIKNCYFIFNGGPAEDSMYSRGVVFSKDSSDSYFGMNVDRCYECVNIFNSSGVFWGINVNNCLDSMFLMDCSGLTNCFGCVNLRMKSYCWFNEQLSRSEYEERLKTVQGSYTKMQAEYLKFQEFALKFPNRENHNLKVQNCRGDYLMECKNVVNSFEIASSENVMFAFSAKKLKDSLGVVGFGFNSESLFDCAAVGYSSNVIGSVIVENSQNILNSFSLYGCSDCIGCASLKNGKFCILNKEYREEEYNKIKEKIIQELKEKELYGYMIPSEISPFGYNESIVMDNAPLNETEVLAFGCRWEEDLQKTEGKETIKTEDIPDNIEEVNESFLKEICVCFDCKRNYKLTSQEFSFYKKMKLPIPRKCFYCRHKDRLQKRGPYKFWDRDCAKCGKSISTNYDLNRPEIVYCESCYQKEVY